MTKQELFDNFWVRYMHRNDLSADLEPTFAVVDSMITERLFSFDVDSALLDLILMNSPRVYIHGGLMYLHELAQDNDGLAREMERFETALQTFCVWYASQTEATASRPYFDGAE